MNTQRNATRILEEEIGNVKVCPRGDQVPPLEKDANDEQAPFNPPSLADGDIWTAFSKWPKLLQQKRKPPLLKHKT